MYSAVVRGRVVVLQWGMEKEKRDEIFYRFVFLLFFAPLFSSPYSISLSLSLSLSFTAPAPRGLAPSSTAREATFDAPSVATRAALRGRRARTVSAAGAAEMDNWSDDGASSSCVASPLGAAARTLAASDDAEAIQEG